MAAATIAAISLLAAAAGTSNALMVSILEQMREIGVRKALGAPASAITRQIVWQPCLVAALAVAGGLALGIGLVRLAGAVIGQFRDPWFTVLARGPLVL